MLKLNSTTIKKGKEIILQNCNSEISLPSVIVAKNEINTSIVAQSFAGYIPLDYGEIYILNYDAEKEDNSKKKIFFVITRDYNKMWRNYNLGEILTVLKTNISKSSFYKKYNFLPDTPFKTLTSFQKLVYFISIGQSLNRSIFILDQPTRYFDYEDLKKFEEFLINDFKDTPYIIFTNHLDNIFSNLNKPIYEIDATKSLILKGGEMNAS